MMGIIRFSKRTEINCRSGQTLFGGEIGCILPVRKETTINIIRIPPMATEPPMEPVFALCIDARAPGKEGHADSSAKIA